MPTTDTTLALRLLEQFGETRTNFALLHGLDGLMSGTLRSDVDLVVGRPLRTAVSDLRQRAASIGLHLICYWPYDLGAASTFWATADAADGVHLDVVHDPDGRGRVGLRSGVVLDAAVDRGRVPNLAPEDELLYLIRKRWLKGQGSDIDALLAGLDPPTVAALCARASEVFSERAAEVVGSLLVHGESSAAVPRPRFAARQVPRLLNRLARPIGFWAEVTGSEHGLDEAIQLAERFDPVLVHAKAAERPAGRIAEIRWTSMSVTPVRTRPALYVSCADRVRGPRPDLTLLAGTAPQQLASIVVQAMAQRTARVHGMAT